MSSSKRYILAGLCVGASLLILAILLPNNELINAIGFVWICLFGGILMIFRRKALGFCAEWLNYIIERFWFIVWPLFFILAIMILYGIALALFKSL